MLPRSGSTPGAAGCCAGAAEHHVNPAQPGAQAQPSAAQNPAQPGCETSVELFN